jgi:hypothetical protein
MAPRAETVLALGVDRVACELHDQAKLTLGQQRLDCSHDSCLASDHDPLADRKRLVKAEMTAGDNLLAAPQFVAVIEHRKRKL